MGGGSELMEDGSGGSELMGVVNGMGVVGVS